MVVLGDMDQIEQRMMKRVEVMDAKDLFNYFEKWYVSLFSVPLPQDRTREMGYFKRLKKVYGPDAGLILKWLFNSHRGLREGWGADRGRFFRVQVGWLTANYKSWHDTLLDEVRAQTAKERQSRMITVKEVSNGFAGAGALLGRS
jgi:hypothetical protein